MLKKGIKITFSCDDRNHLLVRITKSRGKLTFAEVEEILRYENGPNRQSLAGHYAWLTNCSESTCGGNGMWDADVSDPHGDCVELIQLFDGIDCPLCYKMMPPFEYCPSCGETWNTDK